MEHCCPFPHGQKLQRQSSQLMSSTLCVQGQRRSRTWKSHRAAPPTLTLIAHGRREGPAPRAQVTSLLARPCTLLGALHPSLPCPAGSFTLGDACTGTHLPTKEAVIPCAHCDASTCENCFPFDEGVHHPPPLDCFPGLLTPLLAALRGGVLVPVPPLSPQVGRRLLKPTMPRPPPFRHPATALTAAVAAALWGGGHCDHPPPSPSPPLDRRPM